MAMPTTRHPTTLMTLLEDRQADLGKSDEEMSAALGLSSSGAFRLIKTGDMKVPLQLVSPLAIAISVDAAGLLRLVMTEQASTTLQVIDEIFDPLALTESEKRLIQHCRKLYKGRQMSPVVLDGGPVIALMAA